MNSGQFALIKKDIRGITSNKQIFAVLLIVPLVLTIVLPSIFVFVISFAPDAASNFQKLLDMLPAPNGEYSQQQRILGLILNNIMPPFFLIVPKLLRGRKRKAHLRNIAVFSAVPAAVVPIQNIGRAFGWNDDFLYLVCCHAVGSGDGSVLPDRQSAPSRSELAGDHAFDRTGDLSGCNCCNRAEFCQGTDYRRSPAAGGIPDLPDSRFAHRTIHGHYPNQRGTPLGSGYCSGSTCYIACKRGCWKLHLRKTAEIAALYKI